MSAAPRFVSADALRPETAEIGAPERAAAPRLKGLLAYWESCRRGRSFPARADLSPAAMRECLPWLHLYEPVDGGRDFRIRLLGTALTRAAGIDETGKLVSESAHPRLARRMQAALRRTLKTRGPFRGVAAPPPADAAVFVAVEGLWLPLAADGETIDMILVCTEIVQLGHPC